MKIEKVLQEAKGVSLMTKMNYSETHLTKNFSRWHYFLVLFKIFLKEVFLLRIFLLIPVVMWNEFCDFLTMSYIFSFLFQVRMRWRKSTYKAYKESWLDILIYIYKSLWKPYGTVHILPHPPPPFKKNLVATPSKHYFGSGFRGLPDLDSPNPDPGG